MSADDDWVCPSWHQSWHVFAQNWLSEYCAPQDVTDGSIGTQPHLLQLELFHTLLIGSDGGAFDSNLVLQNGVGGVHGDLIVGGITMWQSQVVVVSVDFDVWEDQLLLDE